MSYDPRISLIVAVSKNGVIGVKNQIPWHIKDDLRRFRLMTEGHTVIAGRTTFEQLRDAYESRGKALPDRNHIVLTTSASYTVNLPKCYVVHSIDSALEKAREIEKDEVFVSGGGAIYNLALGYVKRLYLTLVEADIVGDTFFPDYSDFKKVIMDEVHEEAGFKFRYLTLER